MLFEHTTRIRFGFGIRLGTKYHRRSIGKVQNLFVTNPSDLLRPTDSRKKLVEARNGVLEFHEFGG